MNRESIGAHEPHSPRRYADAAVVAAGAVVGAVVAYLVMSPGGRRLSDSIVEALGAFSSEWQRLCHAAARARLAAAEGWEVLDSRSTTGRM